MNKKKMHVRAQTNAQKGITLIALIITIIVMLILVAVTINMAVNGGLFEKAGQAVGEMQNAINIEQELADGRIQIDDVWYDSIDDYLRNNSKITASDVHNDLKSYLGQTVNYKVAYEDASSYGEEKWEIFYADENNIYIITRGHLESGTLNTTGYEGTSDFTAKYLQSKSPAVVAGLFDKTYDPTAEGTEEDPYLKYSSSYTNMQATQYLLDSTKWSTYVDTSCADWAIGGPTFEMFVKSYNIYKPDVKLTTPKGYGYSNPLSNSGSVLIGTYLNHSNDTSYWMAFPSDDSDRTVGCVVGSNSSVSSYAVDVNKELAFRPVVCLKSNVTLTKDTLNLTETKTSWNIEI